MRVAALYDIHGNLPALEAVLAAAAAERVDVVVSGGDVVGGPFPGQALDRLSRSGDVSFLRGNADRLVLEGTDEHGVDWDGERERLGDERIAQIASWPLGVELELGDLGRVLFCHAIPTSDDPIFTRITPDEDVVRLIGEIDADVLVCGHTHVQFDRTLSNGLRVVNAGSVGMPYEGRRGAFWALLGPGVDLVRTEYDVEAAAAAILETAAPGVEDQARWLLDPPDPDEATTFFETRRGA